MTEKCQALRECSTVNIGSSLYSDARENGHFHQLVLCDGNAHPRVHQEMATPFTFLPRVVSKHTKEWQGISRPPPSPSPLPDPTTDSDSQSEDEGDQDDTALDKVKSKEKATEPAHSKQSTISQDIASLISLALSDYNIWLDADLRWKLDACLGDDISLDEAGCTSPSSSSRKIEMSGLINDLCVCSSRTYQLSPPPPSVSRFTPTDEWSARPIRNGGSESPPHPREPHPRGSDTSPFLFVLRLLCTVLVCLVWHRKNLPEERRGWV